MRNAASTILFLFMCLAASAHAGTLSDGRVNGSGAQRTLAVTDSGQPIPAAMAGERNEDSTTGTDYLATSQETKCTTFDTATNSSTEYNGPAILSYIYVNTVLSAHTVVFKDSATAKLTLPASMAAGTQLTPPGMRFDTNLTIDPDDTSTGNITYCYRPLDTSGARAVTW